MKLVFIRHAETKPDPTVSSHQWRLNERAHEVGKQFAESLRGYDLTHIVTSEEFKAKESGRVIAEAFNISWATAPNLHEHERTGIPFMEQEAWQKLIEAFFANPDDLVVGTKETATQALERFDKAVRGVVEQHANKHLAIVTHASVLSLFIAKYNSSDAYNFWQTLKMPDAVVVSLPGFELPKVL